jgi:hypothetical protein
MPEYVEYPFRRRLVVVSKEVGTKDMLSEQVGENRTWRIEHLLMRDSNDTPEYFRVLIGGEGEEYLVCEHADPEENTPYWYDEPFELNAGDWLIGRVVGASKDDVLEFYFMGVEIRRLL